MKLMSFIKNIFRRIANNGNALPLEQEIRKKKSERILEKMHIPINEGLPFVNTSDNVKIRSEHDIVDRVHILYGLSAIAHGIDKEIVIYNFKKFHLFEKLTNCEKEFIEIEERTMEMNVKASWRVEAIWVLLWSIGYVNFLDLPTSICDMDELHHIVKKPEYIEIMHGSAKILSKMEILDEVDLIFRMHWAVRDLMLKQYIPENLNPNVVMERHYALNWLICTADDWDDITTDT